MKKIMPFLLLLLSLNSLIISPTDSDHVENINGLEEILDQAEEDASVSGLAVLQTSRAMIFRQEIVIGSCWDFINAVYNRSGIQSSMRVAVFKSGHQGPYIHESLIEGGDWLYFINHSYNNVEHSGIFVAWTDFEKKEALIASYVGGSQSRPGSYRKYDLSSVYNVIRTR